MNKFNLAAACFFSAGMALTGTALAKEDKGAKPIYPTSSGNFTECAAVRMKELNIKHVESGASKHFTQIPEGWTVVGGSGGEGHPKLLICR